jgi:hypothetical protein
MLLSKAITHFLLILLSLSVLYIKRIAKAN